MRLVVQNNIQQGIMGFNTVTVVVNEAKFSKFFHKETCHVALYQALIHSRCSLWEKGEANLLKLLGVQTFSVASSMTLNSAVPPDWILTRSPPVRACRGRDLAPRMNQTPFNDIPTPGPSAEQTGGAAKYGQSLLSSPAEAQLKPFTKIAFLSRNSGSICGLSSSEHKGVLN